MVFFVSFWTPYAKFTVFPTTGVSSLSINVLFCSIFSERQICGTDTSPALVTALLARCSCCLVLVSVPPKHVEDTIKHQFERETDYQIFLHFSSVRDGTLRSKNWYNMGPLKSSKSLWKHKKAKIKIYQHLANLSLKLLDLCINRKTSG